MRRARQRLLTLVLAFALATSMVPAGSVGAMLAAETGTVAPRGPVVLTSADRFGIEINVENLSNDVEGFDVFRSTAAGTKGLKLNDKLVTGSRYKDTSAAAGVQYYYTVALAGMPALGQVKAQIIAVEQVAASSATPDKRIVKPEKPAPAPSAAVPAEAIEAMAWTTGTPSAVTTLNASMTWTPAGGPYFIRGDVVVPAGKTLTILPGTKIYFDVEPSGATTSYPRPGVQSATTKADLIVHGKIVAKGTAASPIVFSSINSTVESGTDTLAEAGDWGTVFQDSMDASEISYCEFEFSTMGVWGHKTSRPYVYNSTFRFSNGDIYPWGAISFTSPKYDLATPRVRIVGNFIDPGYSSGEGIDIHHYSTGDDTADRVLDFYVANNTVSGGYPLELYAYDVAPNRPNWPVHGGKYGNFVVKGSFVNNKIINTPHQPIYVDIESEGPGSSATFTTAFSGNTFVSDNSEAFVAYVGANAWGNVTAKPTFTNDKMISADDDAVYVDVWSDESSSTLTANVYATPTFKNCDMRSRSVNYATVNLDADTNSAGLASTNALFNGCSIQSTGRQAVLASSNSAYGMADCSPSFTNSHVRQYEVTNYDAVSLTASTANVGLARVSPTWTGGSCWSSDSRALAAYANSDEGSAEVNPSLNGTDFRAKLEALDLDADGALSSAGSGNAVCSPVIYGSTLSSGDSDAVNADAEACGTGSATASPKITSSSVTAEGNKGVDARAASVRGACTASPVFSESDVWALGEGVYASAQRSGDGTKVADAVASPTFSKTAVVAKYEDALEISVTNAGVGNSTAKPVFSYSDFISVYDGDGVYANVGCESTGTAEVAPTATNSNFKAEWEPVDCMAFGNGTGSVGKIGGTFTNCVLSSAYGSGYTADAYANQQACEASPVFNNCTAEAPDGYAYTVEAAGESSSKTSISSPSWNGGRVSYSADGINVYAASEGGGSCVVAPSVKSMPIFSARNCGIETKSIAWGAGASTNNSYIYNSPITSKFAVTNRAYSEDGTATNSAKTLGASTSSRMRVQVSNDNGVYNETLSDFGNAFDYTQTKNLNVSASNAIVYSDVKSAVGVDATVVAAPVISGVMNDSLWSATGIGLRVRTDAADTGSKSLMAASVTGNTLNAVGSSGIYLEQEGDGTHLSNSVISGNSITNAWETGIGVYAKNPDASATVTISKNTIARSAGAGIDIKGIPGGKVSQNNVSNPGWSGNDGVDYALTSGIVWQGANPAAATVLGNMIVGARGAGIFYDGRGPVTNYNSFTNCLGSTNRPFNYVIATSTAGPYDARYNWWGSTTASGVAQTILVQDFSGVTTEVVNYSGWLTSCQPKLISATHSHPARGKVKFTLKFDRPMDTSIKKLYFGKSSPYKTYNVTGTWSADGKTFTGTRSLSGLPTGVKLYFSRAKDLPGNLMISTSKYVKL